MKASDIMTAPVVTVGPQTSIPEIAALLSKHRISGVPVLRGTSLRHREPGEPGSDAGGKGGASGRRSVRGGDEAIRGRLMKELERQPWWQPLMSSVTVSDGVVHYRGVIDSYDERAAARVAAENVPGVRGVDDRRSIICDIPSMT